MLEEMCDLPMHIHSQIHTRIHALPAKFTVPPDHPANLLTHTLTLLSLPRRKNKYMLSLQTKQLQGALSLDLAVLARLQARTPHPVFTHPSSKPPHLLFLPHLHPILVCLFFYLYASLQSCTATPPTVALSLCSIQCLYSFKVKVISNLNFYLFFKQGLLYHWFEQHPSCHTTFSACPG